MIHFFDGKLDRAELIEILQAERSPLHARSGWVELFPMIRSPMMQVASSRPTGFRIVEM